MFLLTSYGLDSALAQILYYDHTKEQSFFTCSRKRIEEAINMYHPTHVLGFGIDLSYLTDAYLIDREKNVSATANLGKLLNVDKMLFKYASLANTVIDPDPNTVSLVDDVYNYYYAVGHEQFVNKFISTDSMSLTKTELALGKLYAVEHQKLAKDYIDQFCYYKNDIDEYAESGLKFIVTYNLNYTGKDIICNIKSKKDMIQSFMEAVPEENETDEYDNSIKVTVDDFVNIEEQIYDVVSNICDTACDLEKKKAYDRYDAMIHT